MSEESLERIEAARLAGAQTLDFEVLPDSLWQLAQLQQIDAGNSQDCRAVSPH